jgi:hypothetical protein
LGGLSFLPLQRCFHAPPPGVSQFQQPIAGAFLYRQSLGRFSAATPSPRAAFASISAQ